VNGVFVFLHQHAGAIRMKKTSNDGDKILWCLTLAQSLETSPLSCENFAKWREKRIRQTA